MHQIDGSGRFTSVVGVALLLLTAGLAKVAPAEQPAQIEPITTTWVDGPGPAPAPAPSARVRATRQVSVQVPSRAEVGSRFRVRVQLPTATRRPVQLQERGAHGWRVIAAALSSRSGRATLRADAGLRPGHRTLRVRAPRSRPWPALTSIQQVIDVQVRPSAEPPIAVPPGEPEEPTVPETPTEPEGPTEPVPTGEAFDPAEPMPIGAGQLGAATDWQWLHTAGTGRWDPCHVIRWRYNPSGGYAGALTDLSRAFARVAGVTGLRFKYVGTTDLAAAAGERALDAEVLVGWAGAEVPAFARGAVGIGGNTMYPIKGRDVAYEIAHGFVALNRTARLPLGFAASGDPTWGQVMTHEVLHVIGLGHAQAGTQLMAPTVSWRNHLLGAGDVAGSQRLGALRGCL